MHEEQQSNQNRQNEQVEQDFVDIFNSFNNIIGKWNDIRRKPIFLQDGEELHASEIILLKKIQKHPHYNVTQLGRCIHISKAAASQTILRLKRKGYVEKYQPVNDKAVSVRLTEKGNQAVAEYRKKFHDEIAEYSEKLDTFSHEELEIVKRFYGELEVVLEQVFEHE